ncbi:MAG TPA: hypothetical protein V6D17_00050 [Candidatus Obscuribacterales bacterium]
MLRPTIGQAINRPSLTADQLPLTPSERESVDFLNYLAETAAASERQLLKPERTPSFAPIKTNELTVPRRPAALSQESDWFNESIQKGEVTKEPSYLRALAEMLSEHASTVVCKQEPDDAATPAMARSCAVTLLDNWLNTGAGEPASNFLDDDNFIFWEEYDSDWDDEDTLDAGEDSEDHADVLAQDEHAAFIRAGEPANGEGLTRKNPPFRHAVPPDPELDLLPGGRRRERFDTGAEIVKDSLGRVVEVRSPLGPVLRARYDDNGHLLFFVRTDGGGNLQSYGESDKHGVVVRDPEGRVRAAGESMAIDRVGRLSLVRRDGQFWSIDLARGLHVERRQLVDDDGNWHALTAVFGFDGFRMATRFQDMSEPSDMERSTVTSERIRLYGRDGSAIEFESEDDIEALRPSHVWPPGSRPVDKLYRGKWQAGTAWQAVKEYMELLRSGSG